MGLPQRWDPAGPGVLVLPSGRTVRGRGLRTPPTGQPAFTLFLLGRRPPAVAWPARWVRWPDFRLPADRPDAEAALREAWLRAAQERVEVVCAGGRGRTGTALACLAVLDGLAPDAALSLVRERYDRRAVETPWQAAFVRRFAAVRPCR
ncbi:protein phosphatase [Georgenia sp. EYE_87]|uniref:protein-tyrosine phosphatase family protein n=1 Tax=Georgenia sp. EYE_87 TaxID=2853448 RepID=UPI0020059989|nr:protein phosphatase [Georgenia sp. EYE_87]MCK6210454.1 protein phosphatase [Georgenia sp. EYE_87]